MVSPSRGFFQGFGLHFTSRWLRRREHTFTDARRKWHTNENEASSMLLLPDFEVDIWRIGSSSFLNGMLFILGARGSKWNIVHLQRSWISQGVYANVNASVGGMVHTARLTYSKIHWTQSFSGHFTRSKKLTSGQMIPDVWACMGHLSRRKAHL